MSNPIQSNPLISGILLFYKKVKGGIDMTDYDLGLRTFL